MDFSSTDFTKGAVDINSVETIANISPRKQLSNYILK